MSKTTWWLAIGVSGSVLLLLLLLFWDYLWINLIHSGGVDAP